MKLGEKIQQLRKKNGLSQEQLGDKLEVTRQTISNWELGVTQPNPDQLKQLSNEFNVSIDELLDNNIQNIIVEKVTNTEKIAHKTLKTIVLFIVAIIVVLFLAFIGLVAIKIIQKNKDTGRELESTIHCTIYGEEHSYNIVYQELTGIPIASGGDSYFYDILDLGKYDDAHQIFNIINDYVKKNGGSCFLTDGRDVNDIIDISIKEGTLTPEGVTIIIKNKTDYKVGYGLDFYLEKYNYDSNKFEKLKYLNDNYGFNDIGIVATKEERELDQGWKYMYGKLDKGLYRLVKTVNFESDIPVSEMDEYYIWIEFEIE